MNPVRSTTVLTVLGLAAAVCAALLLSGCSPSTTATPPPASSAPTSASPSAAPTSTLGVAKQKAVDEATTVVQAYLQMIQDLPADPQPNLNDLYTVATTPQVDIDLLDLQEGVRLVRQGKLVIESTPPVVLVSVDPVNVNLKGDPATVTLEVCRDNTAGRSTYDGKPRPGSRQLARYRVVRTTYLPAPGWAVAKVLPPAGHDQPQPC